MKAGVDVEFHVVKGAAHGSRNVITPEARGKILAFLVEKVAGRQPMRILIAPDKLKGSLSAQQAACAISRGIKQARPDADIVEMPVADGGEGTMEAIYAARGGEWISVAAHDPLGRHISARYLWLADDSSAVIGMSVASGARHVKTKRTQSAPRASTSGTGELIRDAVHGGGGAKLHPRRPRRQRHERRRPRHGRGVGISLPHERWRA